ncbi:Pentatricopeptide repeat-containing protein [Hibiscus syriacus]|uniref:Pentatricopeptide repeat-containing protein n=1 Tax=Hibiscus syriacus TaxID=106335 RepID=A0A6A3CIQ9_HIBSY|nr:Pentatricopeptide repeat-containing protein [Hibiscus syriacus]
MFTFSVLAKIFGAAVDYEGIKYVLQEMKSVGVRPNLFVYNTLIEAVGRVGKPAFARSIFEDLVASGLTPNEKTLTAVAKIYGKAGWEIDALKLWEEMKSKNWSMDYILYNTLLTMFADIDGSGGNVDKAMELFEEMSEVGVELNVMGCTCLIQCLGKAGRIDELVRVFTVEDMGRVLACLQQANPLLVAFVNLIEDEKSTLDTVKEEFKYILSDTKDDARRPICNCLIDICRSKNLHGRAHDLLYLGTLYGLYPRLHNKTTYEWSLNVRTLSVGAALTALEEWRGLWPKSLSEHKRCWSCSRLKPVPPELINSPKDCPIPLLLI